MNKENKKRLIIVIALVVSAIIFYVSAIILMKKESTVVDERNHAKIVLSIEHIDISDESYADEIPDCLKEEELSKSAHNRFLAKLLLVLGIVSMVLTCCIINAANIELQKPDEDNSGSYMISHYIRMLPIILICICMIHGILVLTLLSEVTTNAFTTVLLSLVATCPILGLGILFSSERGYYVADENAIIIINPFSEKRLEYSQINSTTCKVEQIKGIYGRWDHFYLFLKIHLKNGKEISLSDKIDSNYLSNPEKYKQMMDNHRFTCVSDYINRHLQGRS